MSISQNNIIMLRRTNWLGAVTELWYKLTEQEIMNVKHNFFYTPIRSNHNWVGTPLPTRKIGFFYETVLNTTLLNYFNSLL